MKSTFAILFLFLSLTCRAQKQEDIHRFENLFAQKDKSFNWTAQLKNNRNEASFIFSALFVMYKEFISSQDIDACVFTPSCSVYAVESIKQKGIVTGYFSAIDRLTRCNPGHKDLPIDPETGKYYDPVK